MKKPEIEQWLREDDPEALKTLWKRADVIRQEHVGDDVHLRGLIEISNHCRRSCGYCGLHAGNTELVRYRMPKEEILDCAREAVEFGYGTVVIQAGEDMELSADWVADLVRTIKAETPLAVTLSLGERENEDYRLWREAGADRYLLRFETSNAELYELIHPSLPGKPSDRFERLQMLSALDYEVGSGVMIGIPGQTYADLANDIGWFSILNLDMIGVGPYIEHPGTSLGRGDVKLPDAGADQVPNTELMTYKVVALARITCPWANIPSTSALATLNLAKGRELGLERGANVVMPNLTPTKYRALYEIYPSKACIKETAAQCRGCMRGRIESIGRTVGTGRGDCVRRRQSAD